MKSRLWICAALALVWPGASEGGQTAKTDFDTFKFAAPTKANSRPAPAAAAPAAGWQVNESTAALTGASSVAALRPSTNTLSNMIGQPETATLVLRCSEGVLAAYVSWPQVLQITNTSFSGGTYQTMVLWKVDQNEIAVNFWDRSTDGIAAGKFNTGGAQKLIAKLFNAHLLVVRLTGSTTQDAIFDLRDIQAVATRVGAPCGVSWKAGK